MTNPEAKRRVASPRAAALARELVRALEIRDPSELEIELIAAHYGALTFYRPLRHEEGHLLRRERRALIVVDERLRGSARARFVVAHELGHFLLHAGTDQFSICTSADLSEYRTSGIESEANRFAAELLMPHAMFAPLCDRNRPCLDDLRALATQFRTSLTATAIQFAQLCPEPFAAVVSRGGRVEYCVRSPSFPFFVAEGHRLTAHTFAGDLHVGRPAPDRPGYVDASGWTEDEDAVDRDLQEHSMRLGDTGLVLSALWLRETA